MVNILKFDLYKMRKSISTWIVIFLVFVFTIASLAITYTSKTSSELPDMIEGIGAQATIVPLEDMTVVDWCIDSISGDFLMLFIAVFIILFACTDYSSGYIKNIYGSIKNKWNYVFSKGIIVLIFTVLSILVAYITTICFNVLIVHSESFGSVQELLKYSTLKMLLLFAYGMIGVCVSLIARKATVGLIVVMGYSFMFSNILYTGINQIVKNIFDVNDFAVEKYTLIGNTVSLGADVQSKEILIIVIVSLSIMLLSSVISSFFFSKRDV